MRTALGILVAVALLGVAAADARPLRAGTITPLGAVGSSCTLKGKKLYGKVQVVTSFPDLKVQRVTSFPDLKVQRVTSFPDSCGKWQFVTSFPDLKIQFVDSFPDLKVQFVSSFPGVP
jgi:hypothetical protein